jgi:hypothetical protein
VALKQPVISKVVVEEGPGAINKASSNIVSKVHTKVTHNYLLAQTSELKENLH